MQTFHAESRTYWFNHWSSAHALPEGDGEQSLTDYRLLGVVLGLAIYNNVLLDFPLPIALYRKICGHEVGLSDLEDFQPTIGKCAAPYPDSRWPVFPGLSWNGPCVLAQRSRAVCIMQVTTAAAGVHWPR